MGSGMGMCMGMGMGMAWIEAHTHASLCCCFFFRTHSIVDKCAFIYRLRLLFCELRAVSSTLPCVFLCRPLAWHLKGRGSGEREGAKWGEGVWKWAHMSNAMSNWIKVIKNQDTKAPKSGVVVRPLSHFHRLQI